MDKIKETPVQPNEVQTPYNKNQICECCVVHFVLKMFQKDEIMLKYHPLGTQKLLFDHFSVN